MPLYQISTSTDVAAKRIEAASAEDALALAGRPDESDWKATAALHHLAGDARLTLASTWIAINLRDVGDRAEMRHVLAPPEPSCDSADAHDWQAPLDVVGGTAESPGITTQGLGATITKCCANCDWIRLHNSFDTTVKGAQGDPVTSLSYRRAEDAGLDIDALRNWQDDRRGKEPGPSP